jgi:N-acetylneuraminic acid mutarotase
VSIGNQLFVWGGLNESGTALDSGALYDPRQDSWVIIENDGDTPSPRGDATAVWTGSQVVVWGGFDPDSGEVLADGAIYDPVDDDWTTMDSAEVARAAAVGVYLDDRVMFWGGEDDDGDPVEGLVRYDPDDDDWQTPDSDSDDPGALVDAAVAVEDDRLWVFGGRTATGMGSSDLAYYSRSSSNGWSSAQSSELSARWGSFAAFVDREVHLWGGRDLDEIFDDGALYETAGDDEWGSPDQQNAPSARYRIHRESGWALAVGDQLVVVAGLDAPGSYLQDGGIYDAAGNGNGWTEIEAWPGSASHAFGAVDWVAGEIVVWGGGNGASLTNTGVRYLP